MLWDDDAEGGDSLCLVLMERETAAAYSVSYTHLTLPTKRIV